MACGNRGIFLPVLLQYVHVLGDFWSPVELEKEHECSCLMLVSSFHRTSDTVSRSRGWPWIPQETHVDCCESQPTHPADWDSLRLPLRQPVSGRGAHRASRKDAREESARHPGTFTVYNCTVFRPRCFPHCCYLPRRDTLTSLQLHYTACKSKYMRWSPLLNFLSIKRQGMTWLSHDVSVRRLRPFSHWGLLLYFGQRALKKQCASENDPSRFSALSYLHCANAMRTGQRSKHNAAISFKANAASLGVKRPS